MKKTRLFVIDDNKSIVGMVKEYFKDSPKIEVSMEAKDGSEGILMIDKNFYTYVFWQIHQIVLFQYYIFSFRIPPISSFNIISCIFFSFNLYNIFFLI